MFKADKGHDYLGRFYLQQFLHISRHHHSEEPEFQTSTNQPTAMHRAPKRDRRAESEPSFVLCITQLGPKNSNPQHAGSCDHLQDQMIHVEILLPGGEPPALSKVPVQQCGVPWQVTAKPLQRDKKLLQQEQWTLVRGKADT